MMNITIINQTNSRAILIIITNAINALEIYRNIIISILYVEISVVNAFCIDETKISYFKKFL